MWATLELVRRPHKESIMDKVDMNKFVIGIMVFLVLIGIATNL